MQTITTAVSSAFVAVVFASAGIASLGAQSLASRVAQAPDGVVRVQFDSRPGVCGDGRDVVGYRTALFARNFQSFGTWRSDRCVAGPLRVSLTVVNGQVAQIHTQVGGGWPSTGSRVTDLGVVPAREASTYFFSLVPRLESATGKDRLLLPAVLADDAPVIQPLLALARDAGRPDHARRQAVMWLGLLGDASVVPALVEFARDDVDDDGQDRKGKKGLGTAAVAALSSLEEGVGVPALMDLARNGGSIGTRRNAAFWLGQSGDPRALRLLHTIIEDDREAGRVRSHAIFALTHGRETPAAEFAWLRGFYSRLAGDDLKDAIIQGMQQDEADGGRWLIERALDARESLKLRKSALFWAGQRKATPTAELVRVYREVHEASLREHAIFVLTQREDAAAIEAVLRIAREDPDTRMRGKALFWLAQKNDPRVRELIADLVLR